MTRFLFYSHDSYGLGHFRRSSLLAAGVVGADPDNEVLIVTGSPRAQAFRQPERVDTIKLPTATKNDRGGYQPRKLASGIDALVRMRSAVIGAAATSYEPDVVVVDHSPIGMAGELRPLLDRYGVAGSRRPRLVLGLRDIIDDASTVRQGWTRDGIWDYVDRYDQIAVYGDDQILTTANELGLASRGSAEVIHTGYLAPTMPDAIGSEPYLLVTAGGGGDGQALMRAYLSAVEAGAVSGLRSIVVTGPLMSAGRRAELLVRCEALANVEVLDFATNMRSLIASAAGVVSMGGYNTVVEELAAGVPTLLIPRHTPRLEQTIRAQRIAPHSDLDWATVEDLTPARVGQFAHRCLHQPRVGTSLNLRGLEKAVELLVSEGAPAHV